jgi:hypothetical protein
MDDRKNEEDLIPQENNDNENLLSRRGFFKQVAKKVLPVIGGAIMSSIPFKAIASSQSCAGCTFNCSTSCGGNCSGSCAY